MLLTLESKIIAILVALLFGAMLFGIGYQYGSKAKGIKDDLVAAKLQLAEDKLINDARNANDALNIELEKQHEQANAALNILLSAPAVIVRVPSTCASKSATPGGSSVPTTGSERTSNTAQVAFDRFRQGLESDAAEWSRALNSCKVVMEWAKAQTKETP